MSDDIQKKLGEMPVPGSTLTLSQTNLLRNVEVTAEKVKIQVASATLAEEVQEFLKAQLTHAAEKYSGLKEIEVEFINLLPKDLNEIKNVIAVMSGKGGVGKSLVSALTAVSLKRQGYSVGILDADITGPSIPRMFGVTERPAGSDTGILPVLSKLGIEVMSVNLFLPREDEAVIWRGPLIGGAIKQFWEEVLWGKLDFLIVDLPPGTADAPLSVLQIIPISGVVMVFTPQELTGMIVKKAVRMVQQLQKPILGIVENMSYLYIPELKKKMEIFGKSNIEAMEKASGAPVLAQIPIDPELAKLCDAGTIEKYSSEEVEKLGAALLKTINKS
jgi:Mrp family chromosome partitioning ATPase